MVSATERPAIAPAGLERHYLSSAWGNMDAAAFAALVADVAANGVQHPITVKDGAVVDGWHRYRAAQEAGRPCPMEGWSGNEADCAALVISRNQHRRHVAKFDVALALARVRLSAGLDDGQTAQQIADGLGISKRHYMAALAEARSELGLAAHAGGRPKAVAEVATAAEADGCNIQDDSKGSADSAGVDAGIFGLDAGTGADGRIHSLDGMAPLAGGSLDAPTAAVARELRPAEDSLPERLPVVLDLAGHVGTLVQTAEEAAREFYRNWPEGRNQRSGIEAALKGLMNLAREMNSRDEVMKSFILQDECGDCGDYMRPELKRAFRQFCDECLRRAPAGSMAAVYDQDGYEVAKRKLLYGA